MDDKDSRCHNGHLCKIQRSGCQKAVALQFDAVDLKLDRIKARIDNMDSALLMRTAELERRLETLNELRSDVVKDRDLFVRKDMFDQAVRVLNEFRSNYNEAHQALSTRLTIIETRSIVWTTMIAGVFLVVQIILHIWKG